MTNEQKINLIGQKILILSQNLDQYRLELQQLQAELEKLKSHPETVRIVTPVIVPPPQPKPEPEVIKTPVVETLPPLTIQKENPISTQIQPPITQATGSSFNMEEFVGSKLITIIGIVILVIGLGIGVKYAIDRNLITETGRVMLAYLAGAALLGLALKLKEKYKAFSAVLLSGGMASLYFTTYAAYTMYSMFPVGVAFGLMLLFTVFTVFAATVYNLQVIAVIGLVGAYAVPILLSDGGGHIEIMFAYMSIINTGILILSFKKYWQVLNHLAFSLSWMVMGIWFMFNYDFTSAPRYFWIMMIFSFVFFLTFYIANMAYKLISKEKFDVMDVIRILSNSFLYFAIGYATLNVAEKKDFLGLFTLMNAAVHCVFSFMVFRNKLMDRKLFYFLIALVLAFLSLAVPVQLDGSWVTLFWAAEGALLFIIGRKKDVRFYESMGMIMILLGVFSLLQDWSNTYLTGSYLGEYIWEFWKPVLNIHFFTSLFVTAMLALCAKIHFRNPLSEEKKTKFPLHQVLDYGLPALLFIFCYLSFWTEISAWFMSAYQDSKVEIPSTEAWAEPGAMLIIYDESLNDWRTITMQLYTLLFAGIFSFLCLVRWKNNVARWFSVNFNLFVALIFTVAGYFALGDLREAYHLRPHAEFYSYGSSMIIVRYLALLLLALTLILANRLLKTETFRTTSFHKFYAGCIVHFFILVALSSELVNINSLIYFQRSRSYYESGAVYRIGFTILWCVYSFGMIAYGIFRRNKIARISAISLFGLTLVKLVTFDTWNLSTGYKVICYLLLGVVLLVVAFLYQKFKNIIFNDDEKVSSEETSRT
jgi:hypothetical protein